MANPYRSEAKSTGASKFKNITGRGGSANPFDGGRESSDRLTGAIKSSKQMPEGDSAGPAGKKAGSRLDKYARGGRAKKGNNVTINIVSPRPPSGAAPDIGAGGLSPPVGLPPGAGIGPGPGPGGPPPGPPIRPPIIPAGAGPGGPPPMMRKSGGRTMAKVEDSKADKMQDAKMAKMMAKKATGGGVGHKYPSIQAGADTGKGRIDKIKAYGLRAKKG